MQIIYADVILANALTHNDSVQISDLKKLKNKIEKICEGVYVDVCMNTITWALQGRPDLFAEDKNNVFHRGNNFYPKLINAQFNWRIPKKIRSKFVKVFKTRRTK